MSGRSILFYILLSCFITLTSTADPGLRESHYQINANFDPEAQYLEVEGILNLYIKENNTSKLSFRIHKQLELNYFTVGKINSFTLDTNGGTFTPNSVELQFELAEPAKKGDLINIKFKYGGKITDYSKWSANVMNPGWIEAGLYFPWFPNGSGSLPATYELEITCPPEYQVFGIGQIEKRDQTWQIYQNKPINDVIIVISEDMKVLSDHLGNLDLTLCLHSMDSLTIQSFSTDLETTYEIYSHWFGNLNNPELTIIESKRDVGGGYARTGTIVFPSFKTVNYASNRVMYTTYIGHEMAHFWWNKANSSTWEDWLNEAFAEYFSLLLVRKVFGQEEFEKQLEERKKNVNDLKPIWGIDRNDPEAYYVLYHKGAVILNELEQNIGEVSFIELSHLCHENNIKTTSDFLDLLESIHGEQVSSRLEMRLKNF